MTPIEAYSSFVLNELNGEQIIHLAEQWLKEGHGEQSICVLAGEKDSTMSNILPMFLNVMKELDLKEPSSLEAAKILLKRDLQKIVNKEADAVETANHIYSMHVNISGEYPDNKYVGDSLGIENICTWLREIGDANSCSMLLYYTNLPKEQAVEKFKEHLIEEAEILLKKMS